MQFVTTALNSVRRKYYYLNNTITPYPKIRWSFLFTLVCLYFYRAYGLEYNVVTYLILFYLLQVGVGFITPQGLSDTSESDSIEIPEI